MNKAMMAILKVLEKHQDRILGSRELSRQLKAHGVDLTERTVRYHMKILDERGLTKVFGKEGRKITEKGVKELANALVSEKVGFIISKIETLSYQTAFDIEKEEGNIILNVSFFPEKEMRHAVRIMKPVFKSPYVMSDKVAVIKEGEKIGDIIVPEGTVGFGTVCSVTINGIFLKAGIPVASRYGGLLQTNSEGPTRFVALISYEGSSLDPLLVFIRSKMTSVKEAVSGGEGNILASFREIPVVSVERANELREKLKGLGMGGILAIGNPNQPLFEVPVGLDKTGMVVVGGLNPIAALEEAGMHSDSKAMAVLYEYKDMIPFSELAKKYI